MVIIIVPKMVPVNNQSINQYEALGNTVGALNNVITVKFFEKNHSELSN